MAGVRRFLSRTIHRSSGWGFQAFFAAILIVAIPLALASRALALLFGLALLTAVLGPVLGFARIGTALLVAAYATVPLNAVHPIPGFATLELSDVFFVGGFLFLAPRFIGTPLHLPPTFVVGAVGLAIVGSLAASTTHAPAANFSLLNDVVTGVAVLPALLVWWRPTHRAVTAAAIAYAVGTSLNIVKALIEGSVGDNRYDGWTSHPNAMGACAVLSLSLVPYLLAAFPLQHRWIPVTVAATSFYAIWLSGSRAALLTAAIITLLYPLFKRSIPAALTVATLCFPALLAVNRAAENLSPNNPLGRLLGAGSAGASNQARAEGARSGIDQFLSHPVLGDGWLTVWGAHNIYLQIAAATGLLGLFCFILLATPIVRPLIVIPAPYGLLAAPALTAFMIGMVDPALGSRYIWSVAALGLCARDLAARRAEVEPRPTSRTPARLEHINGRAVRPPHHARTLGLRT